MERMADKGELISIIVPVYNVKHYLQHCFGTIVMQSYRNLEIILVDDGSTDGSGELCESLSKTDERCIVIHQVNQGLWAARNAGQRIAKGNYVMFVDSDDYLHIDMVKCLYDALVQNPQSGFSICNYKSTESLDEDIHIKYGCDCRILSIEQVFNIDDEGFVYVVWNKLYKRSLIEGLYARNYRIAQDVDYNIRVYSRLKYVAFVGHELYYWMQRGNSATHRGDYWYSANMILTDIYYRNYNELYDVKSIVGDQILKSLYARLLFFKVFAWRTEREKDVSLKSKYILKETWRSYLSCRHIPILKRLYVFVLLCIPPVFIHRFLPVRNLFKKLLVGLKLIRF